MKKTNKTIGIFIIGMSITLLIAILVLLLYDDLSLWDQLVEDRVWIKGDKTYQGLGGQEITVHGGWLRIMSYQFTSDNIFMELLFIGTAITSIIAINNYKKILKAIVYPISIGLISGTLLGVFIPEVSKGTYQNSFYFNTNIFIIVLALGFFISLISVGNYYLRK